MKNAMFIFMGILLLACGGKKEKADAYGNFEADVITLSAQSPGILKTLNVREGQKIDSGQYLGYVDTTSLQLKKEEVRAQYNAIQARSPGIAAQIEVLQEQIQTAREEYERFQPLVEDGAATQKELDDLENRISLLQKQITQVRTQHTPIVKELESVKSKMKQIDHQMTEARIHAPLSGTVLAKLKQAGELVNVGVPLLRMVSLDTLTLKAYIAGTQLTHVRLGQEVEIRVDESENDMISYNGIVRNIADEAEFTPKTIQTKEQRVDLVYAVDIAVPNDGKLKIGMPAEVYFNTKEKQIQ